MFILKDSTQNINKLSDPIKKKTNLKLETRWLNGALDFYDPCLKTELSLK
jgi:hypothetical protein